MKLRRHLFLLIVRPGGNNNISIRIILKFRFDFIPYIIYTLVAGCNLFKTYRIKLKPMKFPFI